MEIAVSFGNLSRETTNDEYNYLNLLRQRSVYYVLEPSSPIYGHSVTLEMVRHFTDSYLKSLRAYAISQFKRIKGLQDSFEEVTYEKLERFFNPLITSTSYGSFRFSIANDFLQREGETREVVSLKSNVVSKYHNEVFTNPLSDEDINTIKQNYADEEVNDIFRPLAKIRSANSAYKVGYFDAEELTKIYPGRIINRQKTHLITVNPPDREEIGTLESLLIHKRSSQPGKFTHKTIFKQELKSYESEIKTNVIEPANHNSIILSEQILINMSFDSASGFTFSFDDLNVAYTDTEYDEANKGFQDAFYKRIVAVINTTDKSEVNEKNLQCIKRLINNPDVLKRDK